MTKNRAAKKATRALAAVQGVNYTTALREGQSSVADHADLVAVMSRVPIAHLAKSERLSATEEVDLIGTAGAVSEAILERFTVTRDGEPMTETDLDSFIEEVLDDIHYGYGEYARLGCDISLDTEQALPAAAAIAIKKALDEKGCQVEVAMPVILEQGTGTNLAALETARQDESAERSRLDFMGNGKAVYAKLLHEMLGDKVAWIDPKGDHRLAPAVTHLGVRADSVPTLTGLDPRIKLSGDRAAVRKRLLEMTTAHLGGTVPATFEEFTALVALHRHGADSDVLAAERQQYIDRITYRTLIDYEQITDDPAVTSILAEVLDETAGVLVYVEQVDSLITRLTGWDEGSSDVVALRRAWSKRDQAALNELESELSRIAPAAVWRFIESAATLALPRRIAEEQARNLIDEYDLGSLEIFEPAPVVLIDRKSDNPRPAFGPVIEAERVPFEMPATGEAYDPLAFSGQHPTFEDAARRKTPSWNISHLEGK